MEIKTTSFILFFQDIPSTNLRVITAGSPRVGNRIFATFYRNQLPLTTRLIHNRDLVPNLPPADAGFYHVPNEVWIFDIIVNSAAEVISKPIVCRNDFVNKTADDCRDRWCSSLDSHCTSIYDHKFMLNVNLGWHRDDSCKDI